MGKKKPKHVRRMQEQPTRMMDDSPRRNLGREIADGLTELVTPRKRWSPDVTPKQGRIVTPRHSAYVVVDLEHNFTYMLNTPQANNNSQGKISVNVGEEGIYIGRGERADIQLLDRKVSLLHAKLSYKNGVLRIADLHSLNGTRVDGAELYTAPKMVGDGSHIDLGLGKMILKYR